VHNDYSDLRELINREPTWWDENGVPRWCEHHPDRAPDIYCRDVALLEIACQSCGRLFKVQMMGNPMTEFMRYGPSKMIGGRYDEYPLAKAITDGSIHYGDPPNIDCCPGGATMNCEDLRVLEYWRRKDFKTEGFGWKRMPEYEVVLPDGRVAHP
jgi:hypothetical protein